MSRRLAARLRLRLDEPSDALAALGAGQEGLIFLPSDLNPEFFELANGLAGEVFQKFVNYRQRAAFVLPEDHGLGDRVTELVRDHRRHPCVRFFASAEEAEDWLES